MAGGRKRGGRSIKGDQGVRSLTSNWSGTRWGTSERES